MHFSAFGRDFEVVVSRNTGLMSVDYTEFVQSLGGELVRREPLQNYSALLPALKYCRSRALFTFTANVWVVADLPGSW